MKKFIAVILLAAFTSPICFASNIKLTNLTTQNARTTPESWNFTSPNSVYGFTNGTNRPWKLRVFVNKLTNGQKSDKLTLKCHDQLSLIKRKKWTECDIQPGEFASFSLLPENFQNGSEGVYETVP